MSNDVTAAALARIEQARDIHAAIPPENPFEAITLHGMKIAAAAVRLVAFAAERNGDWPWWGWTGEDGAGCIGCLADDDDLDDPIGFTDDWTAFPHDPECWAMQLNAAIRAAGEAGNG